MKFILYALLMLSAFVVTAQQTQITIPMANGSDDVEISTNFSATSSDLELGGFDSYNAGAQYVALRFQNINLPTNAQISKAYIQFTTKSGQAQTANLTIRCQQGNAASYISTENLLQRTYVTPVVTWNPTAWTVAAESGLNQQTTNLAAQIQSAIATNWASGNALSFVLQGNATTDNVLNARSYEHNATHAGAPELVIEYTLGTNPCSPDILPPTITNCPANISLTTTNSTAVATWTVPTITDNCTTNITPSVTSAPTAGLTLGSAFPIGTTTVTYNASDAANNNAVPCVFMVTVSGSSSSSTITIPIVDSNDDVEISTNFSATSSDLELGGFDSYNAGAQYVALRFQNVNLPTNAQISKAYIQFTTKDVNTQTANLTIKCQQGNAASYISTENLLLRTYVTPVVTWNPTAWTVAAEKGLNQQTTNLAAQIQSAIATNWTSDNALSFILQGNATTDNILNARSYENNATHAGAPELVIEYTTGVNPCSPDILPPTITNCPANISLTTTNSTAVATWTVPTITDNCTTNITPSVTSAPTAGLTLGSAFPLGTTTITYNANDATNNNAVPCVFTVTVSGSSSSSTITIPIVNSNDDVEISTNFSATSSDLELGGFDSYNAGAQYVALRFQNINLPTNAQISKAYIQFTTKDINTQTANLTIKCQQGNATSYISTENLLQRTYVTPVVSWNPTAWTVAAEKGLNQQTANLAAQIQSAIATNWTSGNALSFVLQGNATTDNILNARSYEHNATHAGAPELVIEYTTGVNPCSPDVLPPTITNCPANISLTTTGTTAVATWTVPTITDNCTTNITPSVISSPTSGLTQGSAFPIGTTTVTYNASDAANNNAVPCVFTVAITGNTTTILNIPISDGNDDVEVSTEFSATSSDLELGGFDSFNAGAQFVALRFQNVTLPPNAFVSKAYIQFTTKAENTETANVLISCQKGNASEYSAAENLLLRTYVPNEVAWNPPAWTLAAESGVNQQTPSLANQIMGAIATNWASGDALSFVLQGDGGQDNILNARSYENNATHAGAPKLVIEYTVGGNPCANDVVLPNFVNCPNNINVTTLGTTGVATWTEPTVTDNCPTNITPSVSSSPTAGLTRGSVFPLGTTTMTYTAHDEANNNAIPCTFTVNISAGTPALFINEVAPQGTIAIPSDWIELYNDGTAVASLDSIYITNKAGTPYKFSLSGLAIPAKGFLILFADNEPTLGNTHLNFKVGASGEKLYLYRKNNGSAVQLAFFESPALSFLEDNVTVGGLSEGQPAPLPAALTKFLGGTPNAANAGGTRYIKVTNSLPRGILSAPSVATLSAPAGTTIRYTTDNSAPSRTNGVIYNQPINISSTTVLKVFAYSANSETRVEAFTYIFPVKGPELTHPEYVTAAEYETGMKQLPIISISSPDITFPITVDEKATTFEYINKFGETGSAALECGVNAYGNSTLDDFKTNLRLKFKNEYGYGNFEYAIFKRDDVDTLNNFTPTTKFDILDLKIGQDGPTSDAYGMTMTSQGLITKTMREMGNIDAHTRYVQCFVNGQYRGIYVLKEHVDEHFGETYYGGNKDLYDYIEGGSDDYNLGSVNLNANEEPQGTIANWNAMRTAAQQNNFQLVKNYLNVSQYIDMMLTIMYFDNEWEFRAIADQALSETKFIVENHDADGALTKSIDDPTPFNYDQKWETTNPTYSMVFKGPGGVFGNLYDGGNKEFKTLVRDRVYEAFQRPNGALTAARLETKLNELKAVVRPAWNMEYALFDEGGYNNFDQEFAAIIPHLPIRFQYNLDKWLEKGLKHTLLPVTFNQPSGTVTMPVLATNPNPNGVIYYTLDGSDPMGNDGIISPAAILYTNHLTLNAGVNNVVARVYFNTEFGPKTKAKYTSAVAVASAQAASILSVNGRLDGQKAVVSWITKTTELVDYFKIEKQNTRGAYELLQTVNAQYSSNRAGIELYNIVDEKLVEGDNIYRVVLFSDVLRTPQYSDPINVKYRPAEIYALYPNPTSDYFDIDLTTVEGKAVSVSIFNSIGTVVLNEKIEKSASSKRINIENLGTGQYSVVIQPEGKRVVMKKLSIVR